MYTTVAAEQVMICNLTEEWFHNSIPTSQFQYGFIVLYLQCVFFLGCVCGKLPAVVKWTIWEWRKSLDMAFGNLNILYVLFLFSNTPFHLSVFVFFFNMMSSTWISAVICKTELSLQLFCLVLNKHYGNTPKSMLGPGPQRLIRHCPWARGTHSPVRQCCLCGVKEGWY